MLVHDVGDVVFGARELTLIASGAAAMGSFFLLAEVAGDDWPHGLSAFVTGGIIGAVVGGFVGGVIGSVQVDPRTVDQGHALRSG